MPLYESVFIIRQDLSVAAAVKIADTYADGVKSTGGEIVKRENWGLLPLAYRIFKNRKGHFFLFNIESPSTTILEMERGMKLDSDTLRCLTTRIEAVTESNSPMMARAERESEEDGRPPREDGRPPREDGRPPREDGRPPSTFKKETSYGAKDMIQAKTSESKAGSQLESTQSSTKTTEQDTKGKGSAS